MKNWFALLFHSCKQKSFYWFFFNFNSMNNFRIPISLSFNIHSHDSHIDRNVTFNQNVIISVSIFINKLIYIVDLREFVRRRTQWESRRGLHAASHWLSKTANGRILPFISIIASVPNSGGSPLWCTHNSSSIYTTTTTTTNTVKVE